MFLDPTIRLFFWNDTIRILVLPKIVASNSLKMRTAASLEILCT